MTYHPVLWSSIETICGMPAGAASIALSKDFPISCAIPSRLSTIMNQQFPENSAAVSGEPRFALITGATSGIGNGFAHELARDGINLVIIARNETRLNEVKRELEDRYSVKVKIIARDLANPEAPAEIFEILKQEGIVLSVLVNNAGFNVYGKFEETDLEEEIKMIDLHIVAVTRMTKLFLRQRSRQGGKPDTQPVVNCRARARTPGCRPFCNAGLHFELFTGAYQRAPGIGCTRDLPLPGPDQKRFFRPCRHE